MAKNAKSGKANRKLVSGGMIVVIVAIVLIIACFFTYISGILPRTLTGVSITETLPDGTTKTVKNFNLLETNMHFQEVFSTYSNYGMVTKEALDAIYNESTGETYRDWLLREAASQMRTLALVERAAQQSDFMQYSKAHDYAAAQTASVDAYAAMYGFSSAQQYMAAMYGTGMTTRDFIDFSAREVLVTEYGYYQKQFGAGIVPTSDQIQAEFNANPNKYYTFDFNRYFIAAAKDADGNITGLDDAVAAANKIAAAAKDSASYRKAVMDYLKEKGDETTLATFDDEADPTFYENYTNESIAYMDSDIQDFFYSDAKPGDVKVVETTTGAFVIYLADKRLDETKTVTYRVLTLTNEAARKSDATAEEIAQGAQDLAAEAATYATSGMDPLAFYNVVKNHSTGEAMLDGEYVAGATADSFVTSDEENPLDMSQVQAGTWLFEEGRQKGDVKILISDDQKTVYVYYFEETAPFWQYSVKNNMITDNFNQWNTDLMANDPHYEVNSGLMKVFIY